MDTLTVAMLSGAGGFFVAAMLGSYRLTKQGYLLEKMWETVKTWKGAADRAAKGHAAAENAYLALTRIAYIRHGRSFKRWTPTDA